MSIKLIGEFMNKKTLNLILVYSFVKIRLAKEQ